ncbi:MAG: class I SAM-dependent methyltransferase [Phycisphaerales bacterium]|nr:class I SAM-dependent methyltransferase [Phycisphaerales bacterium]
MIRDLLVNAGIEAMERGVLPDPVVRAGIRRLCRQRLDEHRRRDPAARVRVMDRLVASMRQGPIAPASRASNEQHYELPPAFFELVLGPHRKYSSGWWPGGTQTLADAEAAALAATCEHAELADGMDVLELGCGWGSLTLWMAERYPNSRITAVSNAASQRRFIEAEVRRRSLSNVRVLTADMNSFAAPGDYDRVVSVEMFEHMRNYDELLARVAGWLRPEGRLLVHVFCHREYAYPFQTEDSDDWMGRHFFTGGLMPSVDLLGRFDEDLAVTQQWWWDGTHYARTAEAWLANMDAQRAAIMPIMEQVYAADATRWFRRWRVFFMACAELFAYDGGREWGVGHFALTPAAASVVPVPVGR